MITRHLWTRVAAVLAVVVLVGGQVAAAETDSLRVEAGRLTSAAGVSDPSAVLRPGLEYAVDGAREVRLSGPHGASLRALPGTRFSVTAVDAERVAVKLVSGVVSDATATAGYLDVATPAGVLRADRGVVFARVANRNVYVEHQAGSKGSAGVFSPGAPAVGLAAGTFRMMALEAGETMPSKTPVVLPTAVATAPVRVADGSMATAPATATPTAAPTAPPAYDPSCGPNPCADPVYVAPAPCAPPPCAPPPTCGGCGEMIRHSGVPVPVRADDTGRSPLTSALGQDACSPDGVCACHCGKIPYVHYVEGLECDVSTYRVGNGLVTVRPASRVRVHRLPDGSLQMWAPNIGRDLALIELNDNQFGYIGDDGFIVINCLGQIEYFRGLVHLYPRHDTPYRQTNPPGDDKNVSEDAIDLPGPKQGSVR
ncbi:MAG: hypothetical protein JNM10_11820 [Planctomycetia bacterium]|nr:hypothetical protein [Planctomycetia bacterium]